MNHLWYRARILQVALSVSTVLGGCRASLPCHVHWGTTLWRTWMSSSLTLTSWPLTWTSYSQSSWSWPLMAFGMHLATRKPFVLSGSAWMSHTLVPRALCCNHSTAAAPTTSRSWWWSLRTALGANLESDLTEQIHGLGCLFNYACLQKLDCNIRGKKMFPQLWCTYCACANMHHQIFLFVPNGHSLNLRISLIMPHTVKTTYPDLPYTKQYYL